MVSFGQPSGASAPLDVGILSTKGSLFLTRPTLMTYIAARGELLQAAQELFEVVQSGAVQGEPAHTWPLHDAARAHHALQQRTTHGSSVLLP